MKYSKYYIIIIVCIIVLCIFLFQYDLKLIITKPYSIESFSVLSSIYRPYIRKYNIFYDNVVNNNIIFLHNKLRKMGYI